MGGPPPEPLTPDQAKQQLRAALDQLSLQGWVRRHPLPAVALAFAAGAFCASDRQMRRLAISALGKYLD